MPRGNVYTAEELKRRHKDQVAAYKKRNPEKYRGYSKAYYHKNKAMIAARRRQLRLEKKYQRIIEVENARRLEANIPLIPLVIYG